MWINNKIIEKLISVDDKIPEGFEKGRLKRPKKIDQLKTVVSKEELISYYIVQNKSFIETMAKFNLQVRKDLRQLLNYYGIRKSPKQRAKNNKSPKRTHEQYIEYGKKSSITQKESWKNKSDKEKEEWSKKQKIAHSTDKFKKNISEINKEYNKNLDSSTKEERNKKRSASCKKSWSNPQLIEKQRATAQRNRDKRKKQNNTCRTLQEQKIFNALLIEYPSTKYDVLVDERYPYHCDFYIQDLDLFIEYQGHPSHGKYPYIENDEKSLNEANRLYGQWRDIYINKDYEKYKKAISSDINFLRIYPSSSLEENIALNNNRFTNIIELIYKSI